MTFPTYFARVDASTANNNAINPDNSETGVFSITFVGDPVIELGPGGVGTEDPDTQVTISGTIDGQLVSGTYSFTLFAIGTLPTSGGGIQKLPLIDGVRLFQGELAYVIQITDPTAPDNSGNTLNLFFLPEADATAVQMAGFAGSGSIPLTGVNYNPPPQPFCFAAGTLIETTKGHLPIEDLQVGDLVVTKDGGAQPVAWAGATDLAWPGAPDTQKPILIGQGALGDGLPASDLRVSPQHHIVLSGALVEQMFGVSEVLAPAKGLTDLPGVRVMEGKKAVQYVHVMLAEHEVITVEGVLTETFYPGPTAIRMLTPAQRASLYAVVPALKDDPENGYGPTARKKITRREAEKLVAAILADRKAEAIAAE